MNMKKQYGNHTKEMTLERLARMTADGFVGVKKELSEKIDTVDTKVDGLRKEMKVEFAEVNSRLNRIELQLIGAHDRRLNKLESDSQMIKTVLEQKLDVTFRNR